MNWGLIIFRILLNIVLVALGIYVLKANPTFVAFSSVAITGYFAHLDGWNEGWA